MREVCAPFPGRADAEFHAGYARRREFGQRADDERNDVQVVHVLNGAFLDRRVLFGFLAAVNLQKREAYS